MTRLHLFNRFNLCLDSITKTNGETSPRLLGVCLRLKDMLGMAWPSEE